MRAIETSTGLIVVGVGRTGVRARLAPDTALGFQYTTSSFSLRNLLRVA